jgi:hypothetical protein
LRIILIVVDTEDALLIIRSAGMNMEAGTNELRSLSAARAACVGSRSSYHWAARRS